MEDHKIKISNVEKSKKIAKQKLHLISQDLDKISQIKSENFEDWMATFQKLAKKYNIPIPSQN